MHVVVREYARLTTAPVETPSLDEARISGTAFDWLCRESARLRGSGASLVQVDDRRWLRLDNYVGVIETPCGSRIEILPKCSQDAEDLRRSRRLLRRMLATCLDLPTRESAPTDIETFDAPLTEWVMRQFLQSLDALVKRGLRFGYHAVQEQQRFLRGRLEVAKQLREPPARRHLFHIEHDVFDADRPENRLLRLALARVCNTTRDAINWRLSHELATLLAASPSSTDVAGDFRRWRHDRLLAHYRSVRPWCALILNEESPLSVHGAWHGISLLFPMEQVFERYVGACLRRTLRADAVLKATASTEHLVSCHCESPMFQLKPDFLLRLGSDAWVLDTKWKLLDQEKAGGRDKYGLAQSDFYQMFAYGHRYLAGRGDMYLVFPATRDFNAALPVFEFSDDLHLWVIPFDLDNGVLLDGQAKPTSAWREGVASAHRIRETIQLHRAL